MVGFTSDHFYLIQTKPKQLVEVRGVCYFYIGSYRKYQQLVVVTLMLQAIHEKIRVNEKVHLDNLNHNNSK